MFNARTYHNSRPDGFAVMEVAGNGPRRFVPLTRTDLAGTVTGPLAALTLTQTFAFAGDPEAPPVEVLYRFPLPGDAAVTGVRVRFGDVEIATALKERDKAEADYAEAKRGGRQAALLTRESVDVFTLAVAGVRPGQEVRVETGYIQLARPDGAGWSLRVPLTTAPRYVRGDEAGSRHADGQPLAVLRDPGHRFALDLTVRGADRVISPTHELTEENGRVRLRAGEVIPDRDCVLTWTPDAGRSPLKVWVEPDPAAGQAYFLALAAVPPAKPGGEAVPREVVLLVDHSGSMEGAKWEAADWAVERFLAGLTDRDAFALGVFHTTTRWFAKRPQSASPEAVRAAVAFLKSSRDAGGTELGVALEQALHLPRAKGTAARHVLVVTDAEVSDAGRLLRLAVGETDRPDRRRVSVLCIDAAPNAALATVLAERGGGVSRFLTSDPAEDDVTTALDEVLADWDAPAWAGLALEVNRPAAEAAGRLVSLRTPGPAAAIDLGDPPAGQPVWAVGRVPLAGDSLMFRLTAGADALAEVAADAGGVPGVKALVGADRIRRLEYLMTSGRTEGDLRAELNRIGYDGPEAWAAVYAENSRAGAEKVVRPLLVAAALESGLPSSETAFVAVRSEAGRPVGETVLVANALPAGWSQQFAGGLGMLTACRMAAPPAGCAAMPPVSRSAKSVRTWGGTPPAAGGVLGSLRTSVMNAFGLGSGAAAPPPTSAGDGLGYVDSCLMASSAAGRADLAPAKIPIAIPADRHPAGDGAVLYDAARTAAGRLTALAISARGLTADAVGPELTILVFVGTDSTPRAKVRVADLLKLGRRPLNVRVAAGQAVRLTVADPAGRWATGVPGLNLALGWAD